MKLAIVHEFLLNYGGAERVLEHVHELYPNAPVYTLRYNPEGMHERMKTWDIRTSLVERTAFFKNRGHNMTTWLYPLAIEDWDFTEYDVVLSLSSGFTHGVITQPKTRHICYYHTPTRYLWDYHFEYLKEKRLERGVKGALAQRFLHRLREWDFLAAQRPDVVLANSKTVQARIQKFYRRDSTVIYPGLDLAQYHPALEHQDYYITASRLTNAKKIEIAVQACTKMKRPLHVIGTGERLEYLQSIAGPTIKFKGFLDDTSLREEMKHARALIWPNVDDFGLVPVEIMASGRPVIAFNKGGATETVVQGKTGVLYEDQSVDGLVAAMHQFEAQEHIFSTEAIAQHAKHFKKEEFQRNLTSAIEKGQTMSVN